MQKRLSNKEAVDGNPPKMGWTTQDKAWINGMNKCFDHLFSPDFCQFNDTETKPCNLAPGQLPVRIHNHDQWEKNVRKVTVKDDGDDGTTKESVNAKTDKK